MLTPNHGIIAFWFNRLLNRRLGTKVSPLWIVIGSMIPDLFHVSDAGIGWLAKYLLFSEFHSETLIETGRFFHSFPVFAVIFSIAFLFVFVIKQGLYYGRTLGFFIGWGFFHIIIDGLTHKTGAWPYLWPWTNHTIHGLIDHSHPLMWLLEITVFVSWLVYVIRKKHSRKHFIALRFTEDKKSDTNKQYIEAKNAPKPINRADL